MQFLKKPLCTGNFLPVHKIFLERPGLLTAARSVDIDLVEPIQETTGEAKKQKKEERTISWEEKMLHDQFVLQTKEVGNQDRWQWLQNGTLKHETESLIFAA